MNDRSDAGRKDGAADGALAEYVTVSERYCWRIDSLEKAFPEDKVFESTR